MTEEKTYTGQLVAIWLGDSGTTKDGKPYQKYTYKIGDKEKPLTFHSFKIQGGVVIGEMVKVSFTEYQTETMDFPSRTMKSIMPATEQDVQQGKNLLANSPKVILTDEEIDTMNKLKDVPESVSKVDFKVTMQEICKINDDRVETLWKIFQNK